MIRSEKLQSALYALHLVLVELRSMASEGTDPAVMAELLDWAEAMPFLIAQQDEDRTESFRSHLAGLADACPRLRRVLSGFDGNQNFFGFASRDPGVTGSQGVA